MRKLELTGKRYGFLTVLESSKIEPATSGRMRRYWLCWCDCGNEKWILSDSLQGGKNISCGCYKKTQLGRKTTTHGFCKERTQMPEYKSWINAKTRCFNPLSHKYPQYGGRGITVCEEWRKDFKKFFSDMGECPQGFTLERINVNGNYEKGNCAWISKRDQCFNKQNSIRINGTCLSEYARKAGVNYKSLHKLYRNKGMDIDAAVSHLKKRSLVLK